MPTNYQARVKITPKAQASPVPPATREGGALAPKLQKAAVANNTGPFLVNPPLRDCPSTDQKASNRGLFSEEILANKSDAAYRVAKRMFDLTFGLILFLIAIPIVALAAVAIRINTPGSPFFFQTRLGKHGKPFRIFKLRGMYIDARARFPSFYDYSQKQDLEFCFHHESDPRVTPAGKFIRKTSIDELPNLWNVLTGDMSLVGPRPEIPEVLALYGSYRDRYLSVKPGITCLSKCTGRDRLTKRETIEFDLDYIRRRSFAFDWVIMWRTFRSVILRRDVF